MELNGNITIWLKDKNLYQIVEDTEFVSESYEVPHVGNCRKLIKNGEYKLGRDSIQNKGYKYFK
jgi:hypothetical protein